MSKSKYQMVDALRAVIDLVLVCGPSQIKIASILSFDISMGEH
jgi:hypothetical protein